MIVGMNWAPMFKIPSGAIEDALNHGLVQSHDRAIYSSTWSSRGSPLRTTERGTSRMSTLKSMLAKGMAKVTKEFTKEKHKAAAATRGGGYIYMSQGRRIA